MDGVQRSNETADISCYFTRSCYNTLCYRYDSRLYIIYGATSYIVHAGTPMPACRVQPRHRRSQVIEHLIQPVTAGLSGLRRCI